LELDTEKVTVSDRSEIMALNVSQLFVDSHREEFATISTAKHGKGMDDGLFHREEVDERFESSNSIGAKPAVFQGKAERNKLLKLEDTECKEQPNSPRLFLHRHIGGSVSKTKSRISVCEK
jgi:hypothetical protein